MVNVQCVNINFVRVVWVVMVQSSCLTHLRPCLWPCHVCLRLCLSQRPFQWMGAQISSQQLLRAAQPYPTAPLQPTNLVLPGKQQLRDTSLNASSSPWGFEAWTTSRNN